MNEILDQQIPSDSAYADGNLRGRTLRDIATKRLLMDKLLTDPAFKKHHRDLFYDVQFISQYRGTYRGFGLTPPS
jgi:hypothetical protein